MLLHQGAAAFTLWTGKPAPLELMQRSSRRPGPAASGRPRASRAGDDPSAAATAGADGPTTAADRWAGSAS